MISILIPAKDYACYPLVEALHKQGEASGMPFEILLGEDGSTAEGLRLNSAADNLSCCRRIISKENIGRARIRNMLAREAQYPYLIFIDCDAVVENEGFISCYARALKKSQVVCGGLYHAPTLPCNDCTLRYRYEKKADKKRDAATRGKAPYDRFTTFNFAIERELFLGIRFNERITKYGHEDTLFGKELKKAGIEILHIDNMLLHNGLESNEIFLKKTEQSLESLAMIEKEIGYTPLLDTVKRLSRYRMTGLFMVYWKHNRKRLRKNLLGNNPSLFRFNLYKLGYYISKTQG